MFNFKLHKKKSFSLLQELLRSSRTQRSTMSHQNETHTFLIGVVRHPYYNVTMLPMTKSTLNATWHSIFQVKFDFFNLVDLIGTCPPAWLSCSCKQHVWPPFLFFMPGRYKTEKFLVQLSKIPTSKLWFQIEKKIQIQILQFFLDQMVSFPAQKVDPFNMILMVEVWIKIKISSLINWFWNPVDSKSILNG